MKELFFIGASCLILTACAQPSANLEGEGVTIYPANIITVNEANPVASAVAVKDGMIVSVGEIDTLKGELGGAIIDDRFASKTLIPGLIDSHVHIALGAMMYNASMVPPWDVPMPDGKVEGANNKAEFLSRASDIIAASEGEAPVIIYGYHNLIHGDLVRQDIDAISGDKPVVIWHYSGHDFYFNSLAIEQAKLTPALVQKFHGVDLDATGQLTGRIYEDAALVAYGYLAPHLTNPQALARGYGRFETLINKAGVTTIAELGYGIFGFPLEDGLHKAFYTPDDSYRLYLVPEHRAFDAAYGQGAIDNMQSRLTDSTVIGTPKVLPQVKLFTDAAFYSQTMKLAAPGYTGGQSAGTDGLWVMGPEEKLAAIMSPYIEAGYDLHVHSNGDAAQSATLAAWTGLSEARVADNPRMVIEHAGLIRPEHFDLAKGENIGLSAASHYVYYMGQNYEEAIGERVKYITPLASASAAGLPTTLHSDAPLAPPAPLLAASVHMSRATRQGGTSTPSERLSAAQALRAVTLDAAWSLGLEDELGSIEIRKRADFTVLEQNPLETEGDKWPDIDVWGVIIDGQIRPNN